MTKEEAIQAMREGKRVTHNVTQLKNRAGNYPQNLKKIV